MKNDKLVLPLWVKVLMYMKDNDNIYQSNIAVDLRITYSYLCGILKQFTNTGLIIINDDLSGRSKYHKLTEKGSKIADNLKSLVIDLGDGINIDSPKHQVRAEINDQPTNTEYRMPDMQHVDEEETPELEPKE